jgi:hypothetical protein
MISVVDAGTSRPINNGSAVVTISAITTGSSPIISYTVTPSPATVPATFTSTTPIVTVTGLTSGTSYTYSVTASNSTDTSAPAVSSAVIATTVPAAPTIGAVTTTSYTTANIAFTAGATGGTPITGYTVTSSPSVPTITTGTTSPLSIVGDFAGGQLYTFTITAQNANGSSLPSSASASVNSLGPNTTDIQASGKNNVVNGDFSLWNKGTSFTLTGAGGLPNAERWLMGKDGVASTVTVSRQAFVLGAAPVAGYEEPYYYQCAYTTAGNSGTYFNPIYQNIDDVRAFAGNTITVSFWAKADTTRTATVNFGQIFGTGGSTTVYTPATSVTVGTTWARYSSVITVPAVTGKTIGTGAYSQVLIQAGTTNAVQTWSFWGVQAEIGSGATNFNTSGGVPNLEAVVAGSVGYDGVLVSNNAVNNPSGSGANAWAGYYVSGKNAIINGGMDINQRGNSSTTGVITAAVAGTTTSYTVSHSFVVGQFVSVVGMNPTTLNGSGVVTAVVAGGFTLGATTTGTMITGGVAYGYPYYLNPTTTLLAYTVDRWQSYRAAFTTGITTTVQPSGLGNFQYALRVQRNAADISTAVMALNTSLESADSVKFAGQQATLSFWARSGANFSSTSSILSPSIAYGTGYDQSICSGFTGQTLITNNVTLTTTWKRYSFTGTIPVTATEIGAVFNYTPVGTAGANDYFDVTGVQLELGTSATSFARHGSSMAGEMTACLRYFQIVPDSITFGLSTARSMIQWAASGVMRTTPSVTLTSTSPYWENIAWSTVGSLTNASLQGGHLTARGGDIVIDGTYATSPVTQWGKLGSVIWASAELL